MSAHGARAPVNSEFAVVSGMLGKSRMYGIQFHPEVRRRGVVSCERAGHAHSPARGGWQVSHTPLGKDILRNFVVSICGARANWSMSSFLEGAWG